ncbi:MAG: LLM class flavin-dependent oxidoreductase [Candidatus Binatia bacterium]
MAKIKEFAVGFENLEAKRFVACARLAEELGFGAFWVPEDYFFRGAFTLASAIASHTTRLTVGIGVVNPYTRHPVLTAMEFGALEEVSDGRTILGLGASVKFWIEDQLKIPYQKPTRAMRESVEIIRRLFRSEQLTYKGRVFQTENVKLNFQPPRTEIPLYLGVIGPQNLEMAGEIADGVVLSALTSPHYARYAVEHMQRGLARSGRKLQDFAVGANLLISVSQNEQEARAAVKPFLATWFALLSGMPDSPLFTCPGFPTEQLQAFGEAFARGEVATHLVTDWMIDTFTIAGSPERCREGLAKIIDAGVTSPVAFEIPGVSAEQTIQDVHQYLLPHFL